MHRIECKNSVAGTLTTKYKNMIIKEVTFTSFCDSFSDTYQDNFTYEGKQALYDYIESVSEDTGEDIMLDIVGLCCDYTEYENVDEYMNDYGTEVVHIRYETEADFIEAVKEEIEEKTILIPIENSEAFIIKQF